MSYPRSQYNTPATNHTSYLYALRPDQAAAKQEEKQSELEQVKEHYLYARQLDPDRLIDLSYRWSERLYVAKINVNGLESFQSIGNRQFEVSRGLVCDKFTKSELDLLVDWDS